MRGFFMDTDDREEFEERAAIRQYDGGFSREEAERLAAEEIAAKRKAVKE